MRRSFYMDYVREGDLVITLGPELFIVRGSIAGSYAWPGNAGSTELKSGGLPALSRHKWKSDSKWRREKNNQL